MGAELQGTATFINKETGESERFKGVAEGTRDTVFRLDFCENGENPQKIYVFESAIDVLSFLQIFRQLYGCEKLKGCALVSMAGLKPEALKPFIESGTEIISCVDNDEHGQKFNRQNGFKDAEMLVNEGVKDWNELVLRWNAGGSWAVV